MAKKYTGSLTLEWYNKQKAIVQLNDKSIRSELDIPAPKINWINRDEALFYLIDEQEGKGNTPFWVSRDDIRVKEARPLVFQKEYRAVKEDKPGTIPGTDQLYTISELTTEIQSNDLSSFLIKGDNLLALNSLKRYFSKVEESEKIKCIYIDPPYNTGVAFEHYNDNFQHSEWLTLMRDRLVLLRDLLVDEGTIFISIDNSESSYLQLLCDDVFGIENRQNIITLKRGSVTGAKVINKGLVNISEFVLCYSKNNEKWSPNKIFRKKERDERYNNVIKNFEDEPYNWVFDTLLEDFASNYQIPKKELKKKLGKSYNEKLDQYVLKNANRVIQFATLDNNSISKSALELKKKSLEDDSKVYVLEREDNRPYYIFRGKLIIFLSDRLVDIDGEKTFAEPVTDIWDDVLPNDLHNEGGVEFRKGKKPEKLLQRIFEFATNEGDVVLDCFGGSGSTFAVAQKMNRKWIGVELGNHADTHIIPRLKSVLIDEDKAGISKAVSWQGGGSFKYYHLGESIIQIDKETGKGEFNWSLGKQFIQESLLLSYDFIVQKELFVLKSINENENPTIGKITGRGGLSLYGIAYLASPESDIVTVSNEDMTTLYKTIKSQSDFQSLIIYTNMGIDIAEDSVPEDMEIIKVPHAIFSELER